MDRTLNITIETKPPIAVLKLGGFMAQLEVYKLKSQIDHLISESHRFLVVDLKGLNFIDSAGIGVLMHGRTECNRAGGHLVLVRSLTSQAHHSLNAAQIYRVIEGFDDVDSAVAMLSRKYGLAPAPSAATGQAVQELAALAEQVQKLEERLRQMEARLADLEKRKTE